MDRKRPPQQARRAMVPLAAAGTVLQPPPSPTSGPGAPLGCIVVALVVMAAAFMVNSPLMGQSGVGPRWAWIFLGFWGELGGLLALLGMLFRQPGLAWVGAALFFVVALMLSGVVWAGHPPALALLAAVAAWQLRRQREADRRHGWLPA